MPKAFKNALGAFLTIVLASTGLSQAHANPVNLSYDQWVATSGYQTLTAANAISTNFYQAQSGIEINATIDGAIQAGSIGTITLNMQATKTAAKSVVIMPNPFAAGTISIVSGFDRGYGYSDVQDLETLDTIPNVDLALDRLKAYDDTVLILDDALFSAGLVVKPSSYFDGAVVSDFELGSTTMKKMTFSEVVTTHDQTDNTTTYNYDGYLAGVGILPATYLHVYQTFASNGALISEYVHISAGADDETMRINIAANNALTIAPIDQSNTLKLSLLVKTGKQIGAEKLMLPKANAIAAKARLLASKAKKPLVLKNITDAAKALKYKVTAIKNGVKLTTKFDDVAGSMCVTVVAKRAVVGRC